MGEDRYIGGVAEAHGLTYVPEMKRRVYQIYLGVLPELLTPFPGVHALIDALSEAGYDLALASSADRIKVSANLDAIGLPESRFRVITAGEDVRDKKPSPSIYLATARRLGHEPRQCTVVEDALSGVRAAKSAGMRCAAVATSFDIAELERAGADIVRPSLANLAIADLDPSAP
jgi:HAD superfamily hydrolase (TIGR01509 family)